MLKKLSDLPTSIKDKIRLKIRQRAIESAKATIILSGLDINELSEEELEIIVAEEERKLLDKIKGMSIVGILAFFGVSFF